MSSQKNLTFQDWYQVLRNQIILSYDSAKEVALKNFDQMAQKLSEQLQVSEALKTGIEEAQNKLPSITGKVSELPKKKK